MLYEECELAGVYAIGSVDDLEAKRFENHLKSCSACQTEVMEHYETIGEMHFALYPGSFQRIRGDVLESVALSQRRQSTSSAKNRWHAGAFMKVAAAVVVLAGFFGALNSRDPYGDEFATAHGSFYVNETSDEAVIRSEVPYSDGIYQMWGIEDGVPVSLGIIDETEENIEIKDYESIAVTLEQREQQSPTSFPLFIYEI